MLRFSFMPSDFNPMLLVLGEPADLMAFAGWLRAFARDGVERRLESASFCRPSDTQVVLTRSEPPLGVAAISLQDKHLTWKIDAEHALDFARHVEELCDGRRKSGSATLVCEVMGEIPVKVSHGEFTDDFLVSLMP